MNLTTISGPGAIGVAPALADNPLEVDDVSDRTCTVDGCPRPHHARGWCAPHYQRWSRLGDPTAGGPDLRKFPQNLTERYEVDPGTGCWVFGGYIEKNGYGRLTRGNRRVWAHRASYEYHVGPIPDGLVLDHLCRNRACVNPSHLEPVTQQENIRRGEGGSHWAAKTHCPQGHPYSGDNLYLNPSKPGIHRICKACMREHGARYRARKRQERQSA